ncbi:preprotein translocase subunit YajC [Mucilaginibacter gotjawali]|uniref:Preprotein translocase subunit YajC n=1 Tax=Mucilaginibacter gotjawali TaxID=1550579 RepID=A0A839SBI3_9SPHI|nr:preprotein translocase subunit YajC [Mucilaginibacter gotjawali]
MKIEKEVKQSIVKNVLLSLFIYILPILLMFLTFYFTGQRPWEKRQVQKEQIKSIKKTHNNLNNGSNI